jgi:hypothetical protein
MTLDAKQLATVIEHSVAAAVPPHTHAATTAGGVAHVATTSGVAVSTSFCSIWVQAKPVLELVSGIVTWIPGAGVTAGAVLAGLIKIGDQISAEVCK